MTNKGRSEVVWLCTASLVILAVVALGFALTYTRAVMVPFVLALFIVSIVSPILDVLVIRLKCPKILAVALTLVVVVIILGLMSLLVTSAISNIVSFSRSYTQNVQDLFHQVYEITSRLERGSDEQVADQKGMPSDGDSAAETTGDHTGMLDLTIEDGNLVAVPLSEEGAEKADVPQEAWPAPGIGELGMDQVIRQLREALINLLKSTIGTTVGTVVGVLRTSVFVSIFVIFLLSGRDPRKIRTGVYADIDQKIRKYTVTKVFISAITGILVWMTLRYIGLKLASVFAILAFLLNFIPSIGSIISTFLPLPVAVAQFQGDIGTIVLVLVVPGMIQMIMGNVIEPKLMGEGLNLHPITIILALSFWGLLWGIVGMFLAAPMTAVIRIILMQFDTLQPIGRLLAGDLPHKQGG